MNDDERFFLEVEQCRMDAGEFDHTGHVRAAWWCLRALGPEVGAERFANALRRFAAHHGVPERYHDTLTRALLSLLYARLSTSPAAEEWPDFAARHPELLHDAPALLAVHYSPERLGSADARARFVAPDRSPLPGIGPGPKKRGSPGSRG